MPQNYQNPKICELYIIHFSKPYIHQLRKIDHQTWAKNLSKHYISNCTRFLKEDLWNLFQISFHHNWDCWFDDFKCIPCCCFPTTIYHSLLIRSREIKWEHSFRIFPFLVENRRILKTKYSFENISPRVWTLNLDWHHFLPTFLCWHKC